MVDRLKRLQGNRTYLLLIVVMTIVTIHVTAVIVRVMQLPDDQFVDALSGVADIVSDFGFFLGSGLFGYMASKGGSALKAYAYYTGTKKQDQQSDPYFLRTDASYSTRNRFDDRDDSEDRASYQGEVEA